MVLIIRQHGQGALITGDTFDVKEMLKNYGGQWNPEENGWFFSREKEVILALTASQLLVQDERPRHRQAAASLAAERCSLASNLGTTQPLPVPPACSASGSIVCTPAPVRMRARSRTPPRAAKPSNPVPEVRLNERTVRERSTALVMAARGVSPEQASLAQKLMQELGDSVAAATAACSDIQRLACVEQVLAAADALDPAALESVGITQQVSRLAFQRSAHAVALRKIARKALIRWSDRRAKAAAIEEEADRSRDAITV